MVSVSHKTDWLTIAAVDQKHHHLAVALICAVIGAWAAFEGGIRMLTSSMKVECAYDLQAGKAYPPGYPVYSFLASLFQDQEWGILVHISLFLRSLPNTGSLLDPVRQNSQGFIAPGFIVAGQMHPKIVGTAHITMHHELHR